MFLISDKNENVLLYTDGVTIDSKTHTIMQNGTNLIRDQSKTQSAIIVQNIEL
jgi:hypothetical protein